MQEKDPGKLVETERQKMETLSGVLKSSGDSHFCSVKILKDESIYLH